MPNIYDVARRAKVSVATVSAVINDSAYVSPLLRTRVSKAITALEYEPNPVARSLATQKSRMLGMIVPDISNPFWPAVVRGAEDRAHAAAYTLLLSNSDDDPAKQELYLTLFLAKREAFAPRLTTVNFPKYELGVEAVRMLLARLECRDRLAELVQLRSALCIRDSCGSLLREPVV